MSSKTKHQVGKRVDSGPQPHTEKSGHMGGRTLPGTQPSFHKRNKKGWTGLQPSHSIFGGPGLARPLLGGQQFGGRIHPSFGVPLRLSRRVRARPLVAAPLSSPARHFPVGGLYFAPPALALCPGCQRLGLSGGGSLSPRQRGSTPAVTLGQGWCSNQRPATLPLIPLDFQHANRVVSSVQGGCRWRLIRRRRTLPAHSRARGCQMVTKQGGKGENDDEGIWRNTYGEVYCSLPHIWYVKVWLPLEQ